jgi:vacuolar-type H+-ATPase subunit H
MNDAGGTGASAGLEPIRRVKEVETAARERLAAFEVQARAELDELRRESEAFVARARAEAERGRTARLARARAEAEQEVAKILAEGRARAAAIRGKEGSELARLREALLSAVLGGFRPKGSRPEA